MNSTNGQRSVQTHPKNSLPVTDDYDDIINLPHHVSSHHPPMSMMARAAQFAPFAALTGYNEAIREREGQS